MTTTLPNLLTFARIVMVPLLAAAFYLPLPWGQWLPFVLFVAASITDFFDGYLARKLNQTSDLGRLMDPIADKLLVMAALVMLVAAGRINTVGLWAALIILAREIFISGLREFLANRTVQIPVSQLAKWKTTTQMAAIILLLPGIDATIVGLSWRLFWQVGMALLVIAALLSIITAAQYVSACRDDINDGTGDNGKDTNGEGTK